jgi:hypothetical protein
MVSKERILGNNGLEGVWKEAAVTYLILGITLPFADTRGFQAFFGLWTACYVITFAELSKCKTKYIGCCEHNESDIE